MEINLNKEIFNPLFFKILDANTDIVISYGGAGSGKSFSMLQALIYKCLTNPKERILCVRQHLTDTKKSIFDNILLICRQWGINNCKSNSTDKSIVFPNGSTIFCLGLDNVENLKSLIVSNIFIEEATQILERDFNQLLLRIRGQQAKNGRVYMCFNPISETHWLKRRFFDEDTIENIIILKTTYLDNKFLTDKDRRLIENFKSIDYNYYRIYALGEWGILDKIGLFYDSFDNKNNCKEILYDPSKPIHMSFDENTSPYMSVILSHIEIVGDETHYNIFKEYALFGKNLDFVMKQILFDFQNHESGLFIYGDSTSQKKSVFLDRDQNFYSIIELYLEKFKPVRRLIPANQAVSISGLFMNKIFRLDDPKIKIWIDYSCQLLIDDLQKCKTDINGNKDKKVINDKERQMKYQESGHLSDSLNYLVIQSSINNFNEFKSGSNFSFKPRGVIKKSNRY